MVASDEELLDLRVIETYIPAFFMIMKTIAVLGFIPLMGWVGMGEQSIYNLVGTLLFIDRTLSPIGNARCGNAVDSNMSVACVLLCFIINTERVRTAYVDSARDIVMNSLWCFVALFLLVRDELPLRRVWLVAAFPSPDIFVSALMFYIHTLLPLSSATVLELSIRAITFQCLSVSWFYTFRLRGKVQENAFIMCMVRFFPVMFTGTIISCVFAGMVWVCIMYKFYQQHSEFRNQFGGGGRKMPTPDPDPVETPVYHHRVNHPVNVQPREKATIYEYEEDDEDAHLLREILQQKRETGIQSGAV